MIVDEIEALKIAIAAQPPIEWPWQASYYISQEDGDWCVYTERECVVRVNQTTGAVLGAPALDPVAAFSIAREYAAQAGLKWKPAFSLQASPEHWTVGSCQRQLGGQVSIKVGQQGGVLDHSVNPK